MEQNELIDIEDLPPQNNVEVVSFDHLLPKPVLRLEGEKDLVFVYGTLKAKEAANYKLKDCKCLGSVLSPVGWTLTGQNDAFPKAWPVGGRRVVGEVYIVPKGVLATLDAYEGYPMFYSRKRIQVILENGSEVYPWIYYIKGSKQGTDVPPNKDGHIEWSRRAA